MVGTGRTAAAAWVATLAAASALLPLVEAGDWLLQAGLLLGLVSAAGVLARRFRLPTAVAAVCQALLAVVLLTVATVPQFAVGGFLPGVLAVDEFGRLFAAGAEDVGHYTTPAPLTEGIVLLLLCAVVGVGLLVDLLAVSLRSAAAAGLPLLALYSAAAGISPDGAGWGYFVLAAAGFLLLLYVEGRHQLAAWGRYFPAPAAVPAHPPTHPPAYPPPPPNPPGGARRRSVRRPRPRPRAGRRIGAVAIAAAVAAPLALPALGDGLLDPAGGSGRDGGGEAGSIAVDPVVALQDQLNQPENRTILRYETDSERPAELYLRLVALDDFTGEEWRSTGEVTEDLPEAPWPVAGLDPEVATVESTTTISAASDYSQRSLPVPVPAVDIAVSGTWAYDVLSRTLRSPDSTTRTGGRSWEVRHLLVEPTREQLQQAPEPESELVRDHFTQVPDELPDVVHTTALRVTADAETPYDQAVALQNWFLREGGFRYDTDVASGTGPEAVAGFLADREGFCVHFAFTMAAMARTLGIPAQVSVGFTPGTRQADGSFEVGLHNAHAWPELYFEGVGWTRFEPTPGQGTAPSYTRPERGGDTDPVEERESTPAEEGTDQPSPEPTESEEGAAPPRCDPMLPPEECLDLVGEEATEDSGAAVGWPVVAGGAAAALLAALALGPWWWRSRLRRRRLAPGAGVLAAWAELTDSAWDHGVPPDPAETPRQAAARLVRTGDLGRDPAAVAAVDRLAGAVERELYAPAHAGGDPAPVPRRKPTGPVADGQPGADVRTVLAGLRATAPGVTARFRARVAPSSAIRVMQRFGAFRHRVGERVGVTVRRAVPHRARHGDPPGPAPGAPAGR